MDHIDIIVQNIHWTTDLIVQILHWTIKRFNSAEPTLDQKEI